MMSIKMLSDQISRLEQLEVEDYRDGSEYLAALVTGDMLNQGPKECEMYNNECYAYLKNILIPKMEELSFEFKFLFHRIYPTGSYYDGLRNVSDLRSTEVDINIVLSVLTPTMQEYIKNEDIKIINNEQVPNGFVKILCHERCVQCLQHKKGQPFNTQVIFKQMAIDKNTKSHFHDPKYFLHPNKTLTWFCKLVKDATRNITNQDLEEFSSFTQVPKLLNRQGPSQPIQFTLKSDTGGKRFLNVDLVVAFEFGVDLYHSIDVTGWRFRNLTNREKEQPSFFVIPKIVQDKKELDKDKKGATRKNRHSSIDSSSDSLNWRIDFHDQERIILDDLRFPLSKPVIKILKLYKYVNALILSSYLIKSVVMHLITKSTHSKFVGMSLPNAVLYALQVLCSFLGKRKCPYLFDEGCNLFWNTSSRDLICMSKKINADIQRIQTGGINVWKNVLIKKLPLVDEILYSNKARVSGRSESWRPHVKKNNNYHTIDKTLKEAIQDNDDHPDNALLKDVRISKPNRIVKYSQR